MKIRKFKENDREALRDVYLLTRRQTFEWLTKSDLTRSDFDTDTDRESIWVCERNEQVVGFISAQPSGKFIHNLFILPEFTNRGFGSALLKVCIDEIAYPVQLKCVAKNFKALAFYKSKGWRVQSKGHSIDGEYHLLELTKPHN